MSALLWVMMPHKRRKEGSNPIANFFLGNNCCEPDYLFPFPAPFFCCTHGVFSPPKVPVVNIEDLSLFPANKNPGYFGNPEEEVELGLMVDLDIGNIHGSTQARQTRERINYGLHLVLKLPGTWVPQGRRAKKRRVGDHRSGISRVGGETVSRAPSRCSTCHKVGHYAQTCQQSHV